MFPKRGKAVVKGTLLREGRTGYTEQRLCGGRAVLSDPGIRQGMRAKRLSMAGQSSETEDPPWKSEGTRDRRPSIKETGQEGQGTFHREGRGDRGP